MKDEIKEILDNQKLINVKDDYERIIFEYLANNCSEFSDEHIKQLINLKVKQYKQALDYMTNLQEENERLKKDYGRLMQDNAYTLELEQENKVLLEKYSTIQILYNSSKSSIDETVKYLKIQIDDYKEELQKTDDEDVKLFCIHKIDTYNELLKILQGGDEE